MAILARLAVLAALAASPAIAQAPPPAAEVPACRPQTLVGMTLRDITPGIAASDPRAQPKRLWRLGAKFLRSLESPVAPRGDQALIVIAEPDIWTINTASGSARHAIDPGPVLEVKAPIAPQGAPPEFTALEYGCELEFVTVRAPTPQRTLRWGGINAGLHTYVVGEHSLAILMDDQRGEPLMISYVRQGKPVLVLRYDGYRRGLTDQPDLFRPPPGVTITEGKGSPSRQPTPLD